MAFEPQLAHIRTLNFDGFLDRGLPSRELYTPREIDIDSALSGYRYSGQIKSLSVRGEGRGAILDFWIQTPSGRRITVATIRPGFDETPIDGAIASGLFIGWRSAFGVTARDGVGGLVQLLGTVEETGAITPGPTGGVPAGWGQIVGDITQQSDLAQALQTKVSLAEVEALLDELAEDLLDPAEADARYLPQPVPNFLETYNQAKI
jgi:hypothetical protein